MQHRYATFFGTRREADRALARMVADAERAIAARPAQSRRFGPGTTINDAIDAWCENGWADLSPTTVRRYESMWSVHVRRTIGRRKIIDVSPYELERYFRALKAQGLAESTVRQVRALLRRACRLARRWSGNALPNPIADTDLPTWSIGDTSEVRAPTSDEVRALIDAASDDPPFAVFLRLVAATGVRRGEACAVQWCDVDFSSATVRIDKSVAAAEGGATLKSPKTRASIRTLAIDSQTLRQLEALRELQRDLATDCSLPLGPDGFVFSAEPGGLVVPHPDTMSHAFAKLRKRVGVATDIHIHSLRHFQSTALDPVVSEAQKQARLGWSTVHMARHYTGVITEEDRRAADHVGTLLDGVARFS